MSKGEIRKSLTVLNGGDSYTSSAEFVVIEYGHTISDVLRWLVKESSVGEIQYLLKDVQKDNLRDELVAVCTRRDEIMEEMEKLDD
jgi:DNA-directed RNA polymerase subunit L